MDGNWAPFLIAATELTCTFRCLLLLQFSLSLFLVDSLMCKAAYFLHRVSSCVLLPHGQALRRFGAAALLFGLACLC